MRPLAVIDGRIGVMQITDTLDAGGLERVAVNLANSLPIARYRSHLCTTRREGLLADLVSPHVGRIRLDRRNRFDPNATLRLTRYIRRHDIRILHAHGTALFVSVLASFLGRRVSVVWHNHGGWLAGLHAAPMRLRMFATRTREIIVVNQALRRWCVSVLGLPESRVSYIPNFVDEPSDDDVPATDLPGKPGQRIVSVANLLPPKDPINLLRAMKLVAQEFPEAHLIIVGREGEPSYMASVRAELADPVLCDRVSLLGLRADVPAILKSCDIGVLSSVNEGFPLVLLEYGMAGLPVVATNVGQCGDVMENGGAGLLVEPRDPRALAQALVDLLNSAHLRRDFAQRFYQRVRQHYSRDSVVSKICALYDRLTQNGVCSGCGTC